MLSEAKALEARYRNSHPGFYLVSIEKIAIPVSDIELELLIEELKPLSTITEFLLKFVNQGVDTLEGLQSALGLSKNLTLDAVANEFEEGRLHVDHSFERIQLTDFGRDSLSSLQSVVPMREKTKVLFNKGSWNLEGWKRTEFITQRELNKAEFDGRLIRPSRSITIRQDNFKPQEVDALLKKRLNGRKAVNVLQILDAKPKSHGYVLGDLLIKVREDGSAAVVIDVDGERQEALEAEFQKQDGMQDLTFSSLETKGDQVSLAESVRVLESQDDSSDIGDGAMLETYEHAALFEEALTTATKRLVIVSPWITDKVVNDLFLERLESLLRLNLDVTIAWHFNDGNPKYQKSKDSPRAIRALLALSKKYSRFLFLKLETSHAKILLFDDCYVATSFNWLSFKGSRSESYRLEYGEMRTNPSVVEERYMRLRRDFGLFGHATSEHDIPT